jgi:hypothetical protein
MHDRLIIGVEACERWVERASIWQEQEAKGRNSVGSQVCRLPQESTDTPPTPPGSLLVIFSRIKKTLIPADILHFDIPHLEPLQQELLKD